MNLNGIDASAFTRQLEEQALGPDDTFAFSCDRCGRCCREREDVLLNPADLFRIAKFLNQTPSQVVEHYCECYIGPDSRLPLIRLRPKAYRNTCPFLGPEGCRIHQAKPTVCALYPLGRANDSMQTVIFKLIHSSQSALRNTLRTVDAISIKRTADILLNANHIHIYGQSGGYVAGLYMQQMLLRAGILCQAVNDNLDMQLAANTLTQNDVAVGIAYSGEIRSVIQALTTARAKRAKVIVITATNGSSMAKLAHQVLLYSNDIPDDLHYLHIGSICEISIIGLLQSEILMRENQHEKVASVAKNIITSRKK